MTSSRASLALARTTFVAAVGVFAFGLYVSAHGVCAFERSQDGSPAGDVQPFPWGFVCRDFSRISNICEAF